MEREEIQTQLGEETKYSRWYLNIIFKAKSEKRKKLKKDNPLYTYYENHHILPKSLFSTYGDLKSNSWNGVLLTAREHFICHALIWKHYKSISYNYGIIKMGWAFRSLKYQNNEYQQRCNSKLYTYCKINSTHSKETRLKMSKSQRKRRIINYKKGDKTKDSKRTIYKRVNNDSKNFLESKKLYKSKTRKIASQRYVYFIVDNQYKLRYICKTNFRDFCMIKDLNCILFSKSGKYNKPIATTHKATKKFNGWACIKINYDIVINYNHRNLYVQKLKEIQKYNTYEINIHNQQIRSKNYKNSRLIYKYTIYDNNNDIRYVCENEKFSDFCKRKSLPLSSFRKSYKEDGSRLYTTNVAFANAKKHNKHIFKNWYCVRAII